MPVSSTIRKKRVGQNTGSMKKGEKVNLTGPVRKTGMTVTPREKPPGLGPSRKVVYDRVLLDNSKKTKKQLERNVRKGKKAPVSGPVGRR